jgi:O-acetyl-ADP-ribose deacetylase (regulator of RNase III)
MTASLHYGDILDLDVDVIVNPSNTNLQHGGALAAAIVSAGGRVIQEESNAIRWCDLGSAVVTTAGALRAKHVIHVPTVDYTTRQSASLSQMKEGTHSALTVARGLGAASIAFPLLGAGIAGLRGADVAKVIKAAADAFDEMQVIVCVHWQGDWHEVQRVWSGALEPEPVLDEPSTSS